MTRTAALIIVLASILATLALSIALGLLLGEYRPQTVLYAAGELLAGRWRFDLGSPLGWGMHLATCALLLAIIYRVARGRDNVR